MKKQLLTSLLMATLMVVSVNAATATKPAVVKSPTIVTNVLKCGQYGNINGVVYANGYYVANKIMYTFDDGHNFDLPCQVGYAPSDPDEYFVWALSKNEYPIYPILNENNKLVFSPTAFSKNYVVIGKKKILLETTNTINTALVVIPPGTLYRVSLTRYIKCLL